MMKPLFSALSSRKNQQGFTLIELMIALVIGLVVVLGAGKLFLVGLEGFKTVEALSSKQETVNFAANTLVRDIRRAVVDKYGEPLIFFNDNERYLEVTFLDCGKSAENGSAESGLVSRIYQLSSSPVGGKGYSLRMKQKHSCDEEYHNFDPLVTGFADKGFGYDEESGLLRLQLYSDAPERDEVIEFYAINRTWAVINANEEEDTNPVENDTSPGRGNKK